MVRIVLRKTRYLSFLTTRAGTIRSNLDPFNQHEDARLYDALRRSYLIESAEKERVEGQEANKTRFTLDTIVEAEGANLSVGERSLLSLARALVKDSKVVGTYSLLSVEMPQSDSTFVVLDEATYGQCLIASRA